MDMCYDGALVMPSNYAVMDEEEMMYIEGGGTIKVIASASTVRTIARGTVGLVCGIIGAAFTTNVVVAGISAVLGVVVFDFIIDSCNVKFTGINKKWTNNIFPNCTLNLDKYI